MQRRANIIKCRYPSVDNNDKPMKGIEMNKITLLDGGMGTQLQAAGLKPGEYPEAFGAAHPEIVESIHKKYIDAGSRIIYSNTFGANRNKLAGAGMTVAEAVSANVRSAKNAAACSKGEVKVALDIGPIGELLEPMGTLTFEEAYDIYKETAIAGEEAGVDLIIIETLTDLYEAKAALLAAKENTKLPVWVTMSFEANGRTFLGTAVESMGLTLGSLGADAIGINCSLGPQEILPILKTLSEWTDKPLIVKPNAGLPDPRTGEYAMGPKEFADDMKAFAELGVSYAGGCCGTTPEFIASLSHAFENLEDDYESSGNRPKRSGVCSAGYVAEYGKINVIGERINPTGKKRLQQALRDEDMDYIMKLAIEQQEAGADVLDINVGAPGVDEVRLVQKVVKAVQSVVSLPLQIDSANPEVLEAGLRVVNGRALINSVNGEKDRMDQVFPLAKHYGAALLGLAMDERGLPDSAEMRIEIANNILNESKKYGIKKEDLIIDCLTLTVSAQQEQARETLKALRHVHDEMGMHAALGVSNISFGLPAKIHVTENFLIQALAMGLDFPIVNPNEKIIADAIASFRALSGEDPNCGAYITRFAPEEAERKAKLAQKKNEPDKASKPAQITATTSNAKDDENDPLKLAILKGLKHDTEDAVKELLSNHDGMEIVQKEIIPALDEVGKRYEKEIIFLPQLINSANAACAGLELIKADIARNGGETVNKGKIILATVQGDIHDIGKNIVKVVLENYGYQIIDLGKDVAPEKIVETAREQDVRLVGLSALMTTTVGAMEETIKLIKESGLDCITFVGGAVLTPDYAKSIGADYYSKDAQESVEIAKKVLG